MELVANYVDFSAHNAFAAVLRWCDTAGAFILNRVNDDAARRTLLRRWESSAVMRSIHAELLVRGSAWEATFAGNLCSGTTVTVDPILTRLGRTSYTLQSSVRVRETGQLLARVETVMVQLDESLTKSVPVPCAWALEPLLETAARAEPLPSLERPAGCFTWKSQVRPSDCDLLGHMNNASYAVLMEDARLAFGAFGAFGAFEPASCLRLEFLAQGKAFQDLTLAVWRQGRHLGVEMENGSLLARGLFVEPETPRPRL
ncbi:unnamed protein product [Effrenium voratum]|uniref:Acyl-ACP thioesterase n=1 Tax=Effrenium voratum TaxID=2562239 RepID=A0AA36IN37_9DINO|nr:unnamed protein product [Effrenium voratum]CAJ1426178.1 unnamed protein product [Effrenium voratum]